MPSVIMFTGNVCCKQGRERKRGREDGAEEGTKRREKRKGGMARVEGRMKVMKEENRRGRREEMRSVSEC